MPLSFSLPEETFEFDPVKFTEELFLDADLTEEEMATVRNALSKPKPLSRLQNSVVLRSEARSKIDRAKNAAAEAQRAYDANVKWKADAESELARRLTSAQPPAPTRHSESSPDMITREAFEKSLADIQSKYDKRLADLDEAAVGFNIDVAMVMAKHYRTYGDDLDVGELTKFASSKGLRMTDAYPIFTAPLAEKKRDEEFKKALAQANEEGRQEALSQSAEPHISEFGRDVPASMTNVLGDVLMGRRRTQTLDDGGKPLEGEEAFVRSWNRTNGFTKTEASH